MQVKRDGSLIVLDSVEELDNFDIKQLPRNKDVLLDVIIPNEDEYIRKIYSLANDINKRLHIGRKGTVDFRVRLTETHDDSSLLNQLTPQRTADLKELSDRLANMNSLLTLSSWEFGKDYTVDEVISANGKAHEIIDTLKNIDASPLEKFMYIYDFVTNKIYKEVGDTNSKRDSRYLISVLNGEEIVCVGYATILKYLCNKAGIQCECQHLSANGRDRNHLNNLVYIDDPKYNVKGTFYADACWDSLHMDKDTNELSKTIYYCLLSVDDAAKNLPISNQRMEGLEADFIYSKDPFLIYNSLQNQLTGSEIINHDKEHDLMTAMEAIFGEIDFTAHTKAIDNYLHDESRIENAVNILKEAYARHGIGDDFYKDNPVPKGLDVNHLLALAMCVKESPGYMSVIDKNLETLKDPSKYEECGFHDNRKIPPYSNYKCRSIEEELEDVLENRFAAREPDELCFPREYDLKSALEDFCVARVYTDSVRKRVQVRSVSFAAIEEAKKNIFEKVKTKQNQQ